MKEITVFAPASVGNIGPGFDTLGMAVKKIGDTVHARKNNLKKVQILEITGDGGKLPLAADKNTAGIAAKKALKKMGITDGIDLTIHKNIPGNGLGSSAASAVAGAVAANLLFGGRLSQDEILHLSTEAESYVSGGIFMDNIGASLYGGVILTRPSEKKVLKVGLLRGISVILATPDFPLMTKTARKILPKKIEMGKMIANMSNSCAMVMAVCKKDSVLFGEAITDVVVEPVRSRLIPGFYEVKKAALKAGATGCSISGAGSTMFAVTHENDRADLIGIAMKKAFEKNGAECIITVTKIDGEGAREMKRS
ncbi:MAG: homoserine kinase [Nitrospirae bacterium]|nr:homoserine kinase [Nitrospirota bacterium]MBI3351017.1 homoserine kinase [Nitrospirota bacterium]